MKKLILVTVITVLGLTTINAQKVKFGAKAGLNLAFVTGDDTEDFTPNTDFHFGVMAEWKISDKFALQPEVIYSGQGADTNIDSEGVVSLNYLNVPIMGKYYVTKGLSLEAGPQIGFLLYTEGGSINFEDALKSTDLGVNFGVGYKLDNGLNFSARYNLGLSNIIDFDGVLDKNRNGVFQLSVGYFFF